MPTTTQGRPFFTNFLAAFRAHSAIQKSAAPPPIALSNGIQTTLLPASSTQASPPASPSAPRTISTKQSASSVSLSTSPESSTSSLSPPPPTASFRASRPTHPPYPPPGTPHGPRRRDDSTTARYANSPPPLPNNGTTLPIPLALPPTSCSSTSPTPSPGYTPTSFAQRSRTPSLTRQRARRGSDSSSEGGFAGGKARESGAAAWDMGGNGGGVPEKWYIGGRTAQGEERFYKLGLVKRYGSEDRLSLDRLSL